MTRKRQAAPVKDAARYVEQLQVPDLEENAKRLGIRPRLFSRPAPSTVAAETPSASLIKGQVTAFTSALTGQDKQDVEYTTLAAQLNSDLVVKDNQSLNGMKAWFKNYASVMSNLGWVMSFDWEKYDAGSAGLTIDKVVLKILAAVASQNGVAIAKAAMDALGDLADDSGRLKLFSNSTMSNEAGKFLLSVADKQGEAISMAFGAFAMDFKTRDTSVLWVHWKSSDVHLYRDQKVATFNQDYYAKGARSALETKMQGHAATYVDDLDLGF